MSVWSKDRHLAPKHVYHIAQDPGDVSWTGGIPFWSLRGLIRDIFEYSGDLTNAGCGILGVSSWKGEDWFAVLSGLVSCHLGPRIQRFREPLGGKEPQNPDYRNVGPKRGPPAGEALKGAGRSQHLPVKWSGIVNNCEKVWAVWQLKLCWAPSAFPVPWSRCEP